MTLPLDIKPYFSGADLSYGASNLPTGLSLTPATGIINGEPTEVQTRAVTVTATNTAGSAQQSFTWTITASASVPGQVTGLVATPGDGQVALVWTAPGDGGSALTDYVVERRTGGGAFTVLADGTGTAASYTDTGLTNGVAHDYRVSAVNAEGTGPVSTVVSATPVAPAQGSALSVLAFDHGEIATPSGTAHSFTGIDTAPGEVIVSLTHRGGANDNQVTGVTIGGQAATLVGRQYVSGSTQQEQSVWRATVTGTSTDVVATTVATTSRIGLVAWSVGAIDASAIGFDSSTAGSATSLSATVDVAEGGLVLSHATVISGAVVFAWTGADVRLAETAVSPSYEHGAADRAFASAATGHTVTAAFGGSMPLDTLTVVSVGPV